MKRADKFGTRLKERRPKCDVGWMRILPEGRSAGGRFRDCPPLAQPAVFFLAPSGVGFSELKRLPGRFPYHRAEL